MKFQEILFDILGEAILPHYTGRKARVGDEYELVLDLNQFGSEKNLDMFLEDIGLLSEKDEIIKHRYPEVPTAFHVGKINISENEKNDILTKLNKLEKDEMYKKVYKKYIEDNKEPAALIVKVHEFESLKSGKSEDLIDTGDFENDVMHFFVIEALNFIKNDKNKKNDKGNMSTEDILIRKYKITNDKPSNLINLYFRNYPIVNDFGKIEDAGSIGGVITAVIRDDSKQRVKDNPLDINLVTLINDRSTRTFQRHLIEGSKVMPWSEFESLMNKVNPQAKLDVSGKSEEGLRRVREKREKSEKRFIKFLRQIPEQNKVADDLENYFNQYYNLIGDLGKASDENIKKINANISSLRFTIYQLVDSTSRKTQSKTYEQKEGDVEKIINAYNPKTWKNELMLFFGDIWNRFW